MRYLDAPTTTSLQVFTDRVVHSPSWSLSTPLVGVLGLVVFVVILAIVREATRTSKSWWTR